MPIVYDVSTDLTITIHSTGIPGRITIRFITIPIIIHRGTTHHGRGVGDGTVRITPGVGDIHITGISDGEIITTIIIAFTGIITTVITEDGITTDIHTVAPGTPTPTNTIMEEGVQPEQMFIVREILEEIFQEWWPIALHEIKVPIPETQKHLSMLVPEELPLYRVEEQMVLLKIHR